jgi:hypothetical protein
MVIAKNFMHRSFVFEEGGKVTKVRRQVKGKEVGRIGFLDSGWSVPVNPF